MDQENAKNQLSVIIAIKVDTYLEIVESLDNKETKKGKNQHTPKN